MANKVLDESYLGNNFGGFVRDGNGLLISNVAELTNNEIPDADICTFNGEVINTIWIDDFNFDDYETLNDQLAMWDGEGPGLDEDSTLEDMQNAVKEYINDCYDSNATWPGSNEFYYTDDTLIYNGTTYRIWLCDEYNIVFYGLMPFDMYGKDLYPYSLCADGSSTYCPFEAIIYDVDNMWGYHINNHSDSGFCLLFGR